MNSLFVLVSCRYHLKELCKSEELLPPPFVAAPDYFFLLIICESESNVVHFFNGI